MDTAQLFFRRHQARNDEEFLDRVQSYLAALIQNGQIVGEYMMAGVSGGVLITAGIPEAGALADRHASQWVRKSLRELAALGVARPKVTRELESTTRIPIYYYLSKHVGRSLQAERQRPCPSCGRAWLRKEPLHRIFDFHCRRCRLLSNVAFDVRLTV